MHTLTIDGCDEKIFPHLGARTIKCLQALLSQERKLDALEDERMRVDYGFLVENTKSKQSTEEKSSGTKEQDQKL